MILDRVKEKKRYINGMLISSANIDTVVFKVLSKSNTPNVLIEKDINNRTLLIEYPKGATTNDVHYKEIEVIDDSLELTLKGGYDLLPTIVVNGIEYVQSRNTYNTLNQYLTKDENIHPIVVGHESSINIVLTYHQLNNESESYEDDGINPIDESSKSYMYEDQVNDHNNLFPAYPSNQVGDHNLNSKDSNNPGFDYISWVNSYGDIYVHRLFDSDLLPTVNIYNQSFDKQIINTKDATYSGTVEPFEMNDVKVSSNFIRALKEMYPEINFYTRKQDRNSTEYKEWCKYSITLSGISSQWHYSNLVKDGVFGTKYNSTIDFILEYSTIDLPTLLAKRDQFKIGKFFNDLKYITIPLDTINVQCSIFWDRNQLSEQYSVNTNDDDTGYSVYAYQFSGRVLFINLEHKPIRKVSFAESILFDVIRDMDNLSNVTNVGRSTVISGNNENSHSSIGVIL